ncbi:MAG: anthranilate phosphoribosyltransferase [Magnetococcales bacterium]|nr:anthranilate phosphoribosyltransferase [Magnetococcales bacterium]
MEIKEILGRLVTGGSLDQEEARQVMTMIMSGEVTDAQIGGYLTAMRMKNPSVEEIAGSAQAMREKALRVRASGVVVDTCGTGGDGKGTFNISTTAAFVVAGCGVTVAKHGNRSISSKSGSADLLLALGVKIDLEVAVVEQCMAEVGVGFLFAPRHHGAMRHAMGPRKELGYHTLFNLLGPLTNPAGALRQLIGVFDGRWVEPMAHTLKRLGSQRAMVVHGFDGLDEITTTGPTFVAELTAEGEVITYPIEPEQFGLSRSHPDALLGGDAEYNAEMTKRILGGELGPGRDIVLINAGAALYVAGVASEIGAGVEMAAKAVDEGKAMERLQSLIRVSNSRLDG